MTAEFEELALHSPLGKIVQYDRAYDPNLLFIIPRNKKRYTLSISANQPLPFQGVDVWNVYELSWLNNKGKPEVATAVITVPCTSPTIFESKALKLYLNSFNQSRFDSLATIQTTITQDLSKATGSNVTVTMNPTTHSSTLAMVEMQGKCLDTLDIECTSYEVDAHLLAHESADAQQIITESVYSHLFKSNCPITKQPDWASIQLTYTGKPLSHRKLLQYLVSYRNHNEFHEHCAERIFMDILHHCKPSQLTVDVRFTRRGGIDINPYRSTESTLPSYTRWWRQ